MKYDEYDLLWLFENEPINSGSFNNGDYDGEFYYSIKKQDGFGLRLCMDVYEEWVTLSITYNDKGVFYSKLNKVTSLVKSGSSLIISVRNEPFIEVLFKEQLSVELISDDQKSVYSDLVVQNLV